MTPMAITAQVLPREALHALAPGCLLATRPQTLMGQACHGEPSGNAP